MREKKIKNVRSCRSKRSAEPKTFGGSGSANDNAYHTFIMYPNTEYINVCLRIRIIYLLCLPSGHAKRTGATYRKSEKTLNGQILRKTHETRPRVTPVRGKKTVKPENPHRTFILGLAVCDSSFVSSERRVRERDSRF